MLRVNCGRSERIKEWDWWHCWFLPRFHNVDFIVYIAAFRIAVTINKLCFSMSSSQHHPWHTPLLPATTNFASHHLAEAVLSKYNLYMPVRVCDTYCCTNVALWHYYRVQDGHIGEKKLEQMFPAWERDPFVFFQSLVYLTPDGRWLPLST